MRRVANICPLALLVCFMAAEMPEQQSSANAIKMAARMIFQGQYNEAIGKLEQVLETAPQQPEAMTYLTTAQFYLERDFLKAQKRFEEAYRAGGGASFLVNHSHEIAKLGTGELADYCRGWLHLRKDSVSFEPDSGDHGFRFAPAEITELKQNRLSPRLFHIRRGKSNFNFRPRTGLEEEVLLIVVLYKKFAQP